MTRGRKGELFPSQTAGWHWSRIPNPLGSEEERGRMLKLLDDESTPKRSSTSVKAQQPVRIASFEC
jgi:hypothetical protein